MTNLDLNKFPQIDNSISFLKYDPLVEFPNILKYEDIAERIYGCNSFIGANSDNKYPNFAERANFRVALSEFASISEIIKINYPKKRQSLFIDNTTFPLFHFFKLLRVVNFHLKSIKNSFHPQTLTTINTITIEVSSERIKASFFIIENCDYQLFSKCDNVKYYDVTELTKVVEWIDHNQKHWGIFYLLERTLKQYCELISILLKRNIQILETYQNHE